MIFICPFECCCHIIIITWSYHRYSSPAHSLSPHHPSYHPPHPTHLTIAEAIEVAHDVQAKKTWLTHLTHLTLHAEREALLPPDVRLAYDGLQLDL